MFIEYDDKGEINHICFLHPVEQPQALRDQGKNVLELDPQMLTQIRIDEHYVKDGEVLPRPVGPLVLGKYEIAADDNDTVVLAGITDEWDIYVDGLLMGKSNEPLEFTSAIVHDYEIVGVGPWPYLPFRQTVRAV